MDPTGEILPDGSGAVLGRDFVPVVPTTTEPAQQETAGIQDGTMLPMSPEEQWNLQKGVFADKKKEKEGWFQRKPSRHGSDDRQPGSSSERNVGGHHGGSEEHSKVPKGPKSNPGGKGH